MKSLALLVGLALLLMTVESRSYIERSEHENHHIEDLTDNTENGKEHRGGQMRHRRKRWQMNYGYEYPPYNPYYLERRDYDRNQELVPQIWRLLDEISTYVRRPQPAAVPQIVYVPVPYAVPQNCTCNVQVAPPVNVTKRFPELDDVNQNWGIAEGSNSQDDYEDDGSDGSRPISFDPITPKTPMQRQQPEVEHGSTEATQQSSTNESQKVERVVPKNAGTCNAVILTCCSERDKQLQKACFTRQGCAMTYTRGNGCSKQSIAAAIEAFRAVYSPS